MTSWSAIWKNMPLPLREEAAEAMLAQYEEKKDAQALEAINAEIVKGCRMRPQRVRGKSRAQRAKLIAKAKPLDHDVIVSSLRIMHARRRIPLMTTFLDALGLEHEDGSTRELPEEPASVDELLPAMRVLLHKHARADCDLYWDVLTAMGGYWERLPEAHAALLTAEVELAADPKKPTVERVALEVQTPVGFTDLDHTVIDAVLASVARTEGALGRDAVRAMVEELVALNGKRVVSYHHLGFLDALESTAELTVSFPEADEERRGWYLAGAVAALARRAEHASILGLLDRYPAAFARFGLGTHPAFGRVLPGLFTALEAEGRAVEAASLFHPQAVAAAWEDLAEPLMAAAVGFLRHQHVDDAEPLLELVERTGAAAGEFQSRLQRRRAHCLRLRRKWPQAEQLLDKIANEDEDTLLTDRGLVACRMRGLVDVVLPSDPGGRGAFAKALEPGRAWFEAAAQARNNRGHGDFCLGVLHVAEGDAGAAQPHLRRAVAELSRSASPYRELGILGRAQLYLAFSESCAMDVARAPAAFAALGRGLADCPSEVPDLVRQTIENLALVVPRRAREFLAEWREQLGDGFLDIACQAQFLRDEPELRELVRQRAARLTRSADQRFSDHEALLAAAVATGETDAAADELDALEALGDELPDRFLSLLDDSARRGTLWNADEVALARARVLRGQGCLADAAACLRDVAFRLLRDGGNDAVRQAAELDELIGTFGLESESQLTTAIERARSLPDADAAPGDEKPAQGRILFVGGHETQARYDDGVRAWVSKRFPEVDLVLKHPGWESTWARQLKRMETDLAGCDALVIMRFVRTQLGRTLRKRCNERGIRWYACTGHGMDSICRAIESAADDLRV